MNLLPTFSTYFNMVSFLKSYSKKTKVVNFCPGVYKLPIPLSKTVLKCVKTMFFNILSCSISSKNTKPNSSENIKVICSDSVEFW